MAPATDTLRQKKGAIPELRPLCTDSVERLPLYSQCSRLQNENTPTLIVEGTYQRGLAHSERSRNVSWLFFFFFFFFIPV